MYKVGQRFTCPYGCTYMLAQVGYAQLCLVDLAMGNRWNDWVRVGDPLKIAEKEFAKITDGREFTPNED